MNLNKLLSMKSRINFQTNLVQNLFNKKNIWMTPKTTRKVNLQELRTILELLGFTNNCILC